MQFLMVKNNIVTKFCDFCETNIMSDGKVRQCCFYFLRNKPFFNLRSSNSDHNDFFGKREQKATFDLICENQCFRFQICQLQNFKIFMISNKE